MSVYTQIIKQGLLVHSHNPSQHWEVSLPEFERLLMDHANQVGVIEFRTQTTQRGYAVINPRLPDETLKALLLDRIPDAQDVRITRAEGEV